MEVYQLIRRYSESHPTGHFFDRETLKFFGERISEMRVLKGTVEVNDVCGKSHECYILSSLQRNHPFKPTRVYHYFDSTTFDHIILN